MEKDTPILVYATLPSLDEAELIEWARTHMANYKVPRRVELVDALPYNATGKVVKTELRERAART